jgi:hypothetical protein
MLPLRKYPRTDHLEGSRAQPGDEDLAWVPFAVLADRHLVVEEKVDGANAAVSFTPTGELLLQSRGHFLTGGPRERHFDLFKSWASRHRERLWHVLGSRYVMYGEWLYALHTIFYDALPHYFLEFDVLDTAEGGFLSTERRAALLRGLPVSSVPVLWTGTARRLDQLHELLGPSHFRTTAWGATLRRVCVAHGVDLARVLGATDPTDLMEGIYLKVEEDGRVGGRYKYVRASFAATVLASGSHWLDRPIVPNQLHTSVDLWADRQ